MATSTIHISIDDSQIRVMIETYQRLFPRKIRDFLKTDVSQLMRKSFIRNFQAEGRPKWGPLAKSTQNQRARLGFGRSSPILVRTGKLASEVTSQSDSKHFEEVSQNSDGYTLTMGATSKKYKIHQRGGQFIPQRRMVIIQNEDGENIADKFDDLVKNFRRR